MPLLLILLLLADLFSIALPLIAFQLWREWNEFNGTAADIYADRCLAGAIALVAYMLLGRILIRALLSKKKAGADEPKVVDTARRETINRPDGSTINVAYYGREEGQAIIFVHGLNANSSNWYYQRKYFERDYRIILMDLPGMGRSTRPANGNYSLTNLAGHLRAVIEHSGAKNPILWGHSMGGMAILTLLTQGGQLNDLPIKGAILQHTTYTNPVRTSIFSGLLTALQKPVLTPICYLMIFFSPLIYIIRWMGYLNGNAHILARLLTFAGTQTPRQLEFCTLLSTLTPPAVMARGCLGMFRYDVTKKLAGIKVPVLIVSADKDRLTKPDASIFMMAHVPGADLVSVSPAGHQGLLEQHYDVNESAEIFIKRL